MEFKKSIYSNTIKYSKIEMPFGDFYFCEKFIISEINEGIHFDWEMIKSVITKLYEFYGKDVKLGYISNRINSYSSDPQSWDKLNKELDAIVASAIVTYSNITFMNASLEKKFYKKSIKRCLSLPEAVEWVYKLKELN